MDIETQMRKASADIGADITDATLGAQKRLEPVQSKFSEWQTMNRSELKEHRAAFEKRLQAFDARRRELDSATTARVQKKLEHFDSLRAKRADLLSKRPRLEKRLEKAFPTMKWYHRNTNK